MALDTHWKVMIDDAVQELAGEQKKSILESFVTRRSKGGEAAMFDAIGDADDADDDDISTVADFRENFDGITTPVLADLVNLLTSHKKIEKVRTYCGARRSKWDHWFRDVDEVAENASRHSAVLKAGVQKLAKNKDKYILNALFAATQSRGKNMADLAAVAFPAEQEMTVTGGVFKKEACSEILRRMEDNHVTDPIFCAIDPLQKQQMIDNSGDKIGDKNFVTNAQLLTTGDLPDVYGVHFIVHPLVKTYKGANLGCFAAFTMDAIILNQFKAIVSKMDEAEAFDFQIIMLLREYLNACRVDDKKVIQGAITA